MCYRQSECVSYYRASGLWAEWREDDQNEKKRSVRTENPDEMFPQDSRFWDRLMMFIWWGSAGNRMCNYTLIIELNSLLLFSGYENINVSILTSRAARRLFWWSLWLSVRWMLDQDWLQTLCDVTSHVRRPRLLKSDYQWAQRNFSDGRRRRRSRDQIRGKFKR